MQDTPQLNDREQYDESIPLCHHCLRPFDTAWAAGQGILEAAVCRACAALGRGLLWEDHL